MHLRSYTRIGAIMHEVDRYFFQQSAWMENGTALIWCSECTSRASGVERGSNIVNTSFFNGCMSHVPLIPSLWVTARMAQYTYLPMFQVMAWIWLHFQIENGLSTSPLFTCLPAVTRHGWWTSLGWIPPHTHPTPPLTAPYRCPAAVRPSLLYFCRQHRYFITFIRNGELSVCFDWLKQ